MENKNNKYLLMKLLCIINLLGLIFISVFVFNSKLNDKKIGFINNGEVFSSFKMTKELDETLKNVEQSRKYILDSLLNEIKSLNPEKDKEKVERLKNSYLNKRNVFSEDINKIKKSSQEKIANQLNQYIKEFSKDNKYYLVLGANGDGNIWYSEDKNDITKEVLDYLNNKYDAKK